MNGEEEHGRHVDGLNVDNLNGVNGRDRERRRLLVRMMQLVKVFIQERPVVDAMRPISQVVLQEKLNILNKALHKKQWLCIHI